MSKKSMFLILMTLAMISISGNASLIVLKTDDTISNDKTCLSNIRLDAGSPMVKSVLQSIPHDKFKLNHPYKPGEVIIKFREDVKLDLTLNKNGLVNTGLTSVDALNTKYKVYSANQVFPCVKKPWLQGVLSYYEFKLPEDVDLITVLDDYNRDPNVEYAGLNYKATVNLIPDDPYYHSYNSWGQGYADLWGLHRISLEDAWSVSTGDHDVVVAVVDTGVDYNHPDLAGNIWVNPGEDMNHNGIVDIEDYNGLDDDMNGYVDDLNGWDFVNNDHDPMDDFGHGTHCAGTISAVGNNNLGVTGVCWGSSIMALKALDNEGSGWPDDLARAICYAADQGADIISNSWGFSYRYPYEPEIAAAVKYAYDQGCVIVFSAGNNNDDVRYYCPQNMKEVLTVAAINYNDGKAWFSNWGEKVELCAPGVDVLSLRASGTDMYAVFNHSASGMHFVPPYDPSAMYYWSQGTSMACPHVAGVAALLLSKNHSLTRDMVMTILSHSGDVLESSLPIGLRLNASDALHRGAALAELDPLPGNGSAQGVVVFTGSGWGENFQYYTVSYGYGRTPPTWLEVMNSSTPVLDGYLASVNVTGINDGYYTVRLTVVCSDGVYSDYTGMIVNNNYDLFHVDDDNTQGPWLGTPEYPYRFISDGVLNAGYGDTVFVHSGCYSDHVMIEQSIRLLGEDKYSTIINYPWYSPDEILYVNADHAKISGFMINSSLGTGIKIEYSDNVVIEDNIFVSHRNTCVWGEDTAFLLFSNNTIKGGYTGLYVYNCSYSRVLNNKMFNVSCGIFIDHAFSTVIEGNVVLNYKNAGITFTGNENKVHNNTLIALNPNNQGVSFGLTVANALYNTITSNTIKNNILEGVCLYNSLYNLISDNTITNNMVGGLSLSSSYNNTISYNNLSENTWYGMILNSNADGNIIHGNIFRNNEYYGLYVYESPHGNIIYHNIFIGNIVFNAYDEGDNTWYDPSGLEGNYWSDYTGVDSNGDGIGDTPYVIPGGSSMDLYPLMHPFILGDVNGDWLVSFADIDYFVVALSGEEYFNQQYQYGNYWAADCNQDGEVSFADIDRFVEFLCNKS